MKADHMAFEVSDMDRAIAFYTEVLELPLLSRQVDEGHGEAFAFVGVEGCNIELLQLLNGPRFSGATIRPSYCPHFAIGVDDLDQVVQRLAEKNVYPVKGPLEITGMVRWVYFADPDNNIIEFVQWMRP